jgi:hypothetical protein
MVGIPFKVLLVAPAKAGAQGNRCGSEALDSRFRGNDERSAGASFELRLGIFENYAQEH